MLAGAKLAIEEMRDGLAEKDSPPAAAQACTPRRVEGKTLPGVKARED